VGWAAGRQFARDDEIAGADRTGVPAHHPFRPRTRTEDNTVHKQIAWRDRQLIAKARLRVTPAHVDIRPPRSTGAASPAAASSGGTVNGTPIDTRPTTASQARSRAQRPATGKAVATA
jgi:hypothetical protein